MPRVFEKEGYRFFFYSNEHDPAHVHVTKGDGEAVLSLGPPAEVELVWEPAWNQSMISEAGKMKLGWV